MSAGAAYSKVAKAISGLCQGPIKSAQNCKLEGLIKLDLFSFMNSGCEAKDSQKSKLNHLY